ncbi:hypothetical protein ACVWZR_003759 [Bradyrhizobium sp. i1.3.1]
MTTDLPTPSDSERVRVGAMVETGDTPRSGACIGAWSPTGASAALTKSGAAISPSISTAPVQNERARFPRMRRPVRSSP